MSTTMSSQKFLSLNHDVLSLVLALISAYDASQLALTSHHAYSLAMPRVLADVSLGGAFHKPVGTPSNLQLQSFCKFMLANVHERLLYLHTLEVRRDAVRKRVDGLWTVDLESVRLLAEVLARAVRLHRVTIWGFDALVDVCPQIVDALSGCAYLGSVCLGGGVPPISVLARAFPNVRHLQFVGGAGSFGPDWVMSSTRPLPNHAWTRLDHVDSGSPILSLVCPIRRVQLRNPLLPDEVVLANALQYIRNAEPVVLSCAVDASLSDEEFVARIPEVACNLKHLELVLHGCDSLASVTAWMMRVGPLLSYLPLLGLSLSSGTPTSFPSPFTSPAASPPSSPRPSIVDLPDLDSAADSVLAPRAEPPSVDSVVRHIAEAVHSLRYISLQPYGIVHNVKGHTDQTEWFEINNHIGRLEMVAEHDSARVTRRLRGLDIYE